MGRAQRNPSLHPMSLMGFATLYPSYKKTDFNSGVSCVNPRELAMADEARSRLGRGLASLIGDVGGEAAHLERPRAQRKVPIEFLKPNPRNPRRDFPDTELGELADSIKQHGVIQPIVVRPVKGEDLNAMEEAQGYHALADEFKRSQDEIAKIVGKSRSHVANMMRLTKLPAEVQGYIASGQLSAGHARALIGVPDPLAAAKRIVEEGLNVRQAEALAHVEGVPERKPQKPRGGKTKDPDTIALETRVSDALGLAVTIDNPDPGGTVHIRYRALH